MVFDRLGTSVVPLATKVCDGVSSGCRFDAVDALCIPATGFVAPGTLTPPTWRASKGPEIVNVRGLVMSVVRHEMKDVGVTLPD